MAPEKDAPPSTGGSKQARASRSPAQTTRSRSGAQSSAARQRRTPTPPEPKNWFERIQQILQDPAAFRQFRNNLPNWVDEFGAFTFVLLGILTFTALINSSGNLTGPFAIALTTAFGNGAYLIAVTFAAIGIMLLLPRAGLGLSFSWSRVVAIEVAFLATQGLLHLLVAREEPRAFAREGKGGGHVGWALSSLMLDFMRHQTALAVLTGVCIVSVGLAMGVGRREIRQVILLFSEGLYYLANRVRPAPPPPADDLPLPPPSRGIAPGIRSSSEPSPSVGKQNRGPLQPGLQSGRYAKRNRPVPPKTDPPVKDQVVVRASDRTPTTTSTSDSTLSSAPSLSNDDEVPIEKVMTDEQFYPEEDDLIEDDGDEAIIPDHDDRPPIAININGRVIEAALPERHIRVTRLDGTTDTQHNEVGYTTIIINGTEVRVPLDEPITKRKVRTSSKVRTVDGRREFVVEGYKDKIKMGRRPKNLPDLELLHYSELKLPTSEEVNLRARLLEDTMLEFDIDADVVDVRVGPTITQYAVSPIKEVMDENGDRQIIRTRVSKIASLSNDLALALSTKTLRIEAPVPGHSYVGIEVPNQEPSIVSLRSLLETEQFYNERKRPLSVPLGRDVSGEPVIIDLASMPHLLMAGTTGSGKSIGLRSMLTSLVMSNSPDTVRLIVLDPKIVEFTQFNGLPHLIGPVETDAERIIGVLRWATREMDRRYTLLEQEKARNIEAYNAILGRRRKEEHMPYIVIFVDEIGDLMMLHPDETEKTLTRLAQKARAAGMHMVVATQRPSTDVITGLIKANFPARISFAVASGIDSRVILDYTGAEALIGRGDLLFLGPDAAGPKRVQGCLVTDEEIDAVVAYWREWQDEQIESGKMDEPSTPPWETAMTRLEALTDLDPVLEEALNVVVQEGQASASLLQRRLGVGYPRAARLIDALHELSIIGSPQAGGKTREVLVRSVDDARRMVQNNRRKQRY